MGVMVKRCRMFVRIEFQDDGAPPPRRFPHWSKP
jgi:hypothetical protein